MEQILLMITLDDAWNYFTSNKFGLIVNLLTVVSFFISIYHLCRIKKIHQEYLIKIRGADLNSKLSESLTKLNKLLDNWDGLTKEIMEVLISIEVSLTWFMPKVEIDTNKEIKKCISVIKRNIRFRKLWFWKQEPVKETYFDIYCQVSKIHQTVKLLIEDKTWEAQRL